MESIIKILVEPSEVAVIVDGRQVIRVIGYTKVIHGDSAEMTGTEPEPMKARTADEVVEEINDILNDFFNA